MAHAYLNTPFSADEINPAVTEAMAEIGIDLTEEFPKPFTDIRAPA
jgi:protein-tyrosine-phosphatase